MKRYLVTGASGNLGRPLSRLASTIAATTSTYYRNPAVGGGDAVQIDLRDSTAVMSLVSDSRPSVIIHAAGSERSDDMTNTNRAGAVNICHAAQQFGSRLIVLSSDLVFDGSAPPYTEESPPTPLSPYGRVKAENEQLFTTRHSNCLVVRTSLIYDLDPRNHQVRWLQQKIDSRLSIPLFVDEIRQPIWAWNLAEILLELVDVAATGILNVAGPQSLSRWHYGCSLLRALGHSPDTVAHPVAAAQVAPGRPRDCTLSLSKARSILKTSLFDLEQALALAKGGTFPGIVEHRSPDDAR
jgi:dTDP-4-dehydrorhamnose reductase